MIERLPPHSVEAEQSVLGALLIDPEAIIEVADFLKSTDFYRPQHAAVYAAMMALYEHRTPTDIVMVSEQVEADGNLEMVGGRAYLGSLSSLTASSVHAASYAHIVHEKAVLRALIAAGGRIAAIGYSNPDAVEDAVDRASEEVYRVSENQLKSNFEPLRSLLGDAYDRIDALYSNRGQVTGIGTGLRDLDILTQGFQPSDLIVIAARPSVGKTSFALNLAEHAAARGAQKVGVFSLEMSKEQLVVRLISSVADIDSQRLRTGFLEEGDFGRIATAMNVLSDAPIFIDDSPSLTVTELRTKARRLKAQSGVDLVIVDYLQLMHAPGAGGKDANRVQEVSAISSGLKHLARELRIPVVALSQMSRGVESRESAEPRLSDLRESGSIEQDADMVMFLWKKKADPDEHATMEGETVFLKLAKNRNGPTGDVSLWFKKAQTKFYPLDPHAA